MTFFKKLAVTTAAVAISASSAVWAHAADTTLTISSWAPPTHPMNADMWPQLTKMIEEATDGRVTAEIKYNLAPPPAQLDLVLDGAADMSWIFHGYNPGRFSATKMIELPGYEGTAEAASVAYQRAHDKYFADLDEHRGVKLVALMTHGVGVLHSAKKIESLDEMNGMKIRIGGGVSGDVGAALGVSGIRVPAPKVYETLASNAADGVMMPMEGKKSFKLTEVAQHTFQVPGGFYRGSFAIVMNEDKFASLSEDDQAALNEIFGEATAKMAGAVWDAADTAGKTASEGTADNSISMASEAEAAKFNEMSKAIIDKVLEEVGGKGVDAAAARDFIAAEMKNM